MAKEKVVSARFVAPFSALFDEDGVQSVSGQDERGREIPDPTPMAPPVGYKPPPTLADMIKRMVASELLQRTADQMDFDTPEEADDFDLPDDPVDPLTPYEEHFLMPNIGVPKDVPSPAADPASAGSPIGAGSGDGTGEPAPDGSKSPAGGSPSPTKGVDTAPPSTST